MHIRRYKFRLGLITLIFIFILTLISFRLVHLQLIRHKRFTKLAHGQHAVKIELEPKRGSILDRNKHPLAQNLRVDSVYAVARDVTQKEETAKILAPVLSKEEALLYERLSRDKLFVWLARKISEEEARRVKGLDLKGVHLIDETKRFYPNNRLACHLIGFAGLDNIGLEGLENRYNEYLNGKNGYKIVVRDAKRREIHAFGGTYIPPIDGYNLILTIDEVIQHITERALRKACKKHNAKAGVAIVMDPYSGGILAMAVEPSYDLNTFSSTEDDVRRNRAVTDLYEPGSVFKVVTASACINEGVVSLDDNFFCENGAWYVVGHTLHDHRGHGNLTFREVIEKSSNIGTVKAAMKLGEKQLYKYIRAYGFNALTGIDLPGEISGIVRPLNRWSKYSITAIPMGQEIGVTPLQLTRAIAAIANGGFLMKPRIVSRIVDTNDEIVKEYKPIRIRRVISEETSLKLKEIMKGVVERGTGKRARLKKFDAAGKTGTSQKVEGGRYSHSKFIASFAGFAPVKRPELVISVMIDEPHPAYFGGTVSGPVFKEIADKALNYLGVEEEPDETSPST
ncbi:MAG: penicillin-binding protein [Candidatus Omnitrophica bacterium]|nr:penicillin-binding protein [Candidatus Omnitrophota bacterium]